MATAIKQRRGNTSEHNAFTGLEAEITVNTETKTIHVHDGSTAGGIPLAKAIDVSSVATQITTADESSDAECFPVFTTDAIGNLAPKTDADGLTYNASSKTLTTTNIVANSISGTVTNATTASSANTIVTSQTGTGDNFLLMVDADANAAQNARVRGEVKWDVGTSNLTIDGTVTANSFTGALTGDVTGNTSGSSGSCTGHAASADIATGFLINYGSSGNIAHDTVKTFAGKTVIYTAGSGNLVIGVPETADMSAGKQIHFVNASGGEIQFDLNESGNSSITIDICTGAAVVNTGSDNPKIVAGGVATLVSLTTNKLVMFGSGVIDT